MTQILTSHFVNMKLKRKCATLFHCVSKTETACMEVMGLKLWD